MYLNFKIHEDTLHSLSDARRLARTRHIVERERSSDRLFVDSELVSSLERVLTQVQRLTPNALAKCIHLRVSETPQLAYSNLVHTICKIRDKWLSSIDVEGTEADDDTEPASDNSAKPPSAQPPSKMGIDFLLS